jgi:hypothetical protein
MIGRSMRPWIPPAALISSIAISEASRSVCSTIATEPVNENKIPTGLSSPNAFACAALVPKSRLGADSPLAVLITPNAPVDLKKSRLFIVSLPVVFYSENATGLLGHQMNWFPRSPFTQIFNSMLSLSFYRDIRGYPKEIKIYISVC